MQGHGENLYSSLSVLCASVFSSFFTAVYQNMRQRFLNHVSSVMFPQQKHNESESRDRISVQLALIAADMDIPIANR